MMPIFALFNPALGMTTVVPEIDPSRPATVDPAKIVQAIRQEKVTNSFGSPTLWAKISTHCQAQGITLPSLRRVLCAGAPVPASLWESSAAWLPGGQLHSPYGATESLPVATISAAEQGRLSSDASPGPGTCLGRPVPEISVKIIALTDGPIASLAEARELPAGEIGEIIAAGPVVTKEYDALPEATAGAKIRGTDGTVWHRIGDCGTLDGTGRLWFCGRKVERVETAKATFFTEPCERVFRRHPRVTRCALIGLGERGRQEPALVVESKAWGQEAETLARELLLLGVASPTTVGIRKFYFYPAFPVDVRHNAKIHRLTLARWAAGRASFPGEP
jgi:acyl-CoA synthetase (AMP-forming)/AMP-acid ligase II